MKTLIAGRFPQKHANDFGYWQNVIQEFASRYEGSQNTAIEFCFSSKFGQIIGHHGTCRNTIITLPSSEMLLGYLKGVKESSIIGKM